MLTNEEAERARDLFRAGHPYAEIARRLGRDRATIRAYLTGRRTVGVRRGHPNPLSPYIPYCIERLSLNPQLTASTLYGDVVARGYPQSYSSFTRALRSLGLRPASRSRTGGSHRFVCSYEY
ncbi:helix-turn-helix domain-containing protein [Streptacidiphilus jiangxiensis]|uniref:Helix-turn-helix domain-containing protein n=1 Tax=Streptacidiphilus jiangxiensis TaxID=235985 RepID=A0A1H8AY22_STRJI|nr:helix-turn-helix domain-containing protein [Streptacidiphilus jiangxiensis]SEM74678.1 Helix-turn-helix domain-containing protein [Streptacidiphilus jiangxiensis]